MASRHGDGRPGRRTRPGPPDRCRWSGRCPGSEAAGPSLKGPYNGPLGVENNPPAMNWAIDQRGQSRGVLDGFPMRSSSSPSAR